MWSIGPLLTFSEELISKMYAVVTVVILLILAIIVKAGFCHASSHVNKIQNYLLLKNT